MNERTLSSLKRIDELWRLHEQKDAPADSEGRCVAFVIDSRYIDSPNGVQMRMAVSFGDNPMFPASKEKTRVVPWFDFSGGPPTSKSRKKFYGQPFLTGQFVFGRHMVGIKGNRLTIYEKWQDGWLAGDCTDGAQGEERAREMLDSMSDADYLTAVRGGNYPDATLKVSGPCLLEDFEVAEGEAF